jgi:hypothetical protein
MRQRFDVSLEWYILIMTMDMEVTANTDGADMAVSSLLIEYHIGDLGPMCICDAQMQMLRRAEHSAVAQPKKEKPTPARAVSLGRLEMRCFPA